MSESPQMSPDSAPNALTQEPRRIHCATTQDGDEVTLNDVDQLAIDHFLGTLAEVAIAVAKRRLQGHHHPEGDITP